VHIRAHRRTGRLVVAGLSAVTALSLSACGEGLNETQDPEPVPDVRGEDDLTDPFTGAYDEEFAEDMSVYTGQEVTLTAQVDEVFSTEVFSITAPDGGDVEPALVVAEDVPDSLEAGTPVVVAATPVEDFDPAAVPGDVDPGDVGEWEGEEYLEAQVVELDENGG
jgi:hypothetical protein